jgi:hypothetical protein
MKKLREAEAQLIKKIEMLQLSLELVQKEIERKDSSNVLNNLFGSFNKQIDEI